MISKTEDKVCTVRVVLPFHLRMLAKITGEIQLDFASGGLHHSSNKFIDVLYLKRNKDRIKILRGEGCVVDAG